ncbi:MAG: AraC family transcriptional regulator [Spirochaetia bacterium]|nr:AraC family transcriptional regulator [Spirochaetia bacterium]MCF7941831.1 AraC family transcriptional regulator [Spirochaetia bacterium]
MNRYTERINRVLDHIDAHLGEDLSLEELAEISCFSKYHFSRIFASVMKEPLFGYITRVRLQKAAARICGNVHEPITEIAASCGYATPSAFAKSFKQFYGISASRMRESFLEGRNTGQPQGTFRTYTSSWEQAIASMRLYTEYTTAYTVWRYEMDEKKVTVTVKTIDEMELAYVRHIGPYAGDEQLFARLFKRLYSWAGPRALVNPPETKELCIYHDDPGLTDESQLRTSACITVPPGTKTGGEIGSMTLPGGLYAVGHFEIGPEEFGEAWQFMCGTWLPESGYEPSDGLCFEMYDSEHGNEDGHSFIVDICIPVKILSQS